MTADEVVNATRDRLRRMREANERLGDVGYVAREIVKTALLISSGNYYMVEKSLFDALVWALKDVDGE